jgi:hypothetical protein
MSTAVYFRHTKTDRRFRVVSIDKAKNVVTLKGEHAEFTQPYDKEQFKRLGYVLERVEE